VALPENIEHLLTDSRATAQGTSWTVEEYLSGDDSLVDRLQKGPRGTLDRLLKLRDELDRLAGTVANGQPQESAAAGSQG